MRTLLPCGCVYDGMARQLCPEHKALVDLAIFHMPQALRLKVAQQ